MTFGAMVKTRRQELQMTQQELAKKIGVHRATVIDYEVRGMEPRNINVKRALCGVLGFSFEQLFGEKDELGMIRMLEEAAQDKVERELLMDFSKVESCVVFANDAVLEGIEQMLDFILKTDDLAKDSRLPVMKLRRKIELERSERKRNTIEDEAHAMGGG